MYDYFGDFDVFERQLSEAGITKEEFDITDYCGLTYRELEGLTKRAIAVKKMREKKREENS